MGRLLTGNSNATEEEYNAALGEFRQPMNRSVGLLMMAGSVPEFAGGLTLSTGGGAATATGVGAAPGIPAMVAGSIVMTHAVDVGSTGWQMFWTGERQETRTYQGVLELTGSPTVAMYVDSGLSMVGAVPAASRTSSRFLGDITLDTASQATISSGVVGNPAAITRGVGKLSSGQKRVLEKLPNYGDKVLVPKRSFGVRDLAALTAETGDEFAMFTTGGRRLIMRGNSGTVPVTPSLGREFAAKGYRWSAHTHPIDPLRRKVGDMMASPGDIDVLDVFPQPQSMIYGSHGEYRRFGASGNVY